MQVGCTNPVHVGVKMLQKPARLAEGYRFRKAQVVGSSPTRGSSFPGFLGGFEARSWRSWCPPDAGTPYKNGTQPGCRTPRVDVMTFWDFLDRNWVPVCVVIVGVAMGASLTAIATCGPERPTTVDAGAP